MQVRRNIPPHACAKCRYDLLGFDYARTWVCPECGEPIAVRIPRDPIVFQSLVIVASTPGAIFALMGALTGPFGLLFAPGEAFLVTVVCWPLTIGWLLGIARLDRRGATPVQRGIAIGAALLPTAIVVLLVLFGVW